jgi:hypothetical protein
MKRPVLLSKTGLFIRRLLKNAHLLRSSHPSSLRSLQGSAGASLLRISGALHLGIFEQPAKNDFFSNLRKLLRRAYPDPSH